MKLRWTTRARADPEAIATRLAGDDQVAARRVVTCIKERLEAVTAFPESCPLLTDGATRRCVVSGTPYMAYYRIIGGMIVVDAVFHERQDRPV
jgi:plasmid stabilization system protein ParE